MGTRARGTGTYRGGMETVESRKIFGVERRPNLGGQLVVVVDDRHVRSAALLQLGCPVLSQALKCAVEQLDVSAVLVTYWYSIRKQTIVFGKYVSGPNTFLHKRLDPSANLLSKRGPLGWHTLS